MRRTAPFSGTLLFVVTALLHSRCYGQRTQSQQQRQHPPTADSRRDGRRRLIVNGRDARRGRYPYFVGIEDYCGGALIAPDMVLTAGHCAPKRRRDDRKIHPRVSAYYNLLDEGGENENDEDNSNKKDKSKKRRRRDADEEEEGKDGDGDDQGRGEGDNGTEYEEVFFDVDAIWVHPNFTRLGDDEFVHDYSVWKLRGAANVSWDFALPRINRDGRVPRNQQRMTVIGLGVLDAEEMVERPHALQQVTIDAIANDVCENTTNPETGETLIGRIHETHLCTYTYFNHNAQDACAYDSGGPILIAPDGGDKGGEGEDSADAAPDLLVGMVSWGIGCADPVFPAVNSRVSAASDWIDEVVCQHSDAPPSSLHEFCHRGRERPPHAIAPTKAAAVRSTLVAVAIRVGVALLLFVCAWLIYDRRLKRAASLRDGGDVEDGEGDDEEYDDMPLITMVSDDADSPNLLSWSPRKPWKTFSSNGRDLRRDSTMTAATADSDEDDAAAAYPRSTESTPLCTPVVGGANGRGSIFAAAGRPPSSSSGGRKTYRPSP